MKIPLSELREQAKKAILHYGYSEEETVRILEVLLYAQLRGNNQGVVKLIGTGIPKSATAGAVAIEKETKLSAWMNGHQTHAMIVVSQATELAIQKAKEHGMSAVGIHGIHTSSGALGFYAKKIAEAGLVGFIFAGSMETVAAAGSFEAILGTNPFAFAVPTESHPFVFDMATAAMAYFGVIEANTAGRSLPEGIAYDRAGNSTTSPAAVLDDGALRTFDQGYKGMGLSMMVQLMTGPLVDSYFTGIGDVKENWGGHFIIAVDPELFGGAVVMKKGASQMIERIKQTKRLPGVEEITVPGERGDRLAEVAIASGMIEIEENLYEALKSVANS